MGNSLAVIRRKLAQRMGMWGGHISNSGPGALTTGPGGANPTANVVYDSARQESDDEWDSAWLVLNPGTLTAAWGQIAEASGYVLSGGQMNLRTALAGGAPSVATPYELYKALKPDQWLMAINWALTHSYPFRHQKVIFEVPEDPDTRVYDYAKFVSDNALTDPTVAPTVAANAQGPNILPAGTYSVAYTFYNALGETLISPTASVTVNGTQSILIQIANPPAQAIGVKYYMSVFNGSTTLGQLTSAGMMVTPTSGVAGYQIGVIAMGSGVVPDVYCLETPRPSATSVPGYNTTTAEIQDLYMVHRRGNPTGGPELWNDLASSGWQPLGGTSIQLMYRPQAQYSLRFICSSTVQVLSAETDISYEPLEMILSGAEYYAWFLISKSATVTGVNWEKLAAAAKTDYEKLKKDYALDQPREVLHRPGIGVGY